VDELGQERSLSHTPVFQVMFILQNAPTGGRSYALGGGVEVSGVERGRKKTAIDLTMVMALYEWEDGYLGTVEYARDLFDETTVRRITAHLDALLSAALAAPDVPLSALPLAHEEARLAEEAWNATAADTPRAPFHRLFEARAAATPEAPALVFGGERLTYAQLNARANRLARRLAARGVGPETLVALALERSPEMVVALLAVNKAGGAFLPVDPEYPEARRRWMLEDSGARVVVTTSGLAAGLPETGAAVVALDRITGEIEAEDDSNHSVEVDPENAAYVIFTSGSTGRPKGVVVPHRGIGNLAAAQRDAFAVTPESRVLQFASFSFDAAVAEVAHALLSGAALVMARPEHAGPELLNLMRNEAVTVATLPPLLLAALPEAGLPELRTVVSAGEAVPAEVVARWGAGRRFVNAYGPTEATVCATVSINPSTGGRPPIGKPIANVRTYVLGARTSPVPVGVPGELYVGGIGVARGYLGRPALTAERFVPDPFSTGAGGRLYRTGDRVRWLGAGELEFLGRVDQQVKVRGFRVEPGEVEAALRAHPGVREAVVLALGEGEAARLVGYVTPAGVDVEAARAGLAARLPAYLVPAALAALDELPRTANGKVDRGALPDPETPAAAFVLPRTPTEEAIAAIWSEVLRRSQVGAHDDFFALGGHSLRAMQVLTRIEARFGVMLPMKTLFTSPTVAGLAEAVEAAGGGALAEALAGLDDLNEDELAALLSELGEDGD
jgi:amino acid adenylation domain-containing protein